MPALPTLNAMDLASLLASRVCHDIISPVGAMANGLEVLDEDQGEEMREFAMDLIQKSAKSASAKLKFSRLAFGASGSAGASIDTGDAEEVAQLYMACEKSDLTWTGIRSLVPKNRAKLMLNLLLLALGSIPRGGKISLEIDGEGEGATFQLRCEGTKARVPAEFLDMLSGTYSGELSAHEVQPYYTILLAQEAGLTLSATAEGEDIVLAAR
ncbi:MAG: histidine phosphotransferase family protein [Pseudomonadota bacterium]